MSKILFVMTGADHWTLADGTEHPSGYWAEEAVTPYEAFTAAGHQVVVATPGGVVPTVDRGSLSPEANGGPEGAARIERALAAMPELRQPIGLDEVKLDEYAAVFYPGGHGPMEDLSADPDSGRLLVDALASGRPLGVVCHGSAALLAAVTADGTNAFAGYRATSFSNTEETLAGLAERAAWLLETRLVEAGVDVRNGEPWAPHVVVDRNLVTGQNPASSAPVAAELLGKLA
ncbi:type 1 glutamine amidotransferase domain-containing protein [Kitasatospora terrestris]|uniref:Type 1 glutamine amidotransferase domain-containing protein n=1 Tax=Kitasatospora terrestris TaxID=258051 RepID=A0ABP9E877_9ACTN